MEILIPGLILVALMAWASTRIKKRAADAFATELIESENYSFQKPDGFLHVVGDLDHEFYAHTSEFADEGNSPVRRGTIEVDVIRDSRLGNVRDQVRREAQDSKIRIEDEEVCELVADETANQTAVTAFYKIVSDHAAIYRLRFAVVTQHKEAYLRKIDETLDSFKVKTN